MKRILNFRDFGGYPTAPGRRVRPGMLYRSAHLDGLAVAELRELQRLGIRTIIDLRPLTEQPRRQPAAAVITTTTIPFDIEGLTRRRLKGLIYKRGAEAHIVTAIDSVYFDMVDMLKGPIALLFETLRREECYPVLIHCRAGKDRTGFAAAIIQLTLGVEASDVLHEYLLTNNQLAAWVRRMLGLWRRLSLGLLPTRNFAEIFTARERYLTTVLDRIDREYGGIGGWLKAAGVGEQARAALERILTESAAPSAPHAAALGEV